jgi:hypothetical protein
MGNIGLSGTMQVALGGVYALEGNHLRWLRQSRSPGIVGIHSY